MREIASPLSGPFTTFGQTPIDIYKVGAYRPELAYSFYNDYYRRGRQPVNLLEAIAHTRNGNATMTGEYGPELVTNGDFSDGSTGWALTAQCSVVNGKAHLYSSDGSYQIVQQGSILEVGKVYEAEFQVVEYVSGYASDNQGNTTLGTSKNGVFRYTFTAIDTSYGLKRGSGGVTDLKLDNISVREVPKIQWAPHNLLTYSEDFSNAAWVKGGVTISTNAAVAPDGTQTADLVTANATLSAHSVYQVVSGVDGSQTHVIWMKANGYTKVALRESDAGIFYTAFDLSDGSEIYNANSATHTIEAESDGWYKLTISGAKSGNTRFSVYILDPSYTTGGVTAWTADGTSGIYIWGAHLYRSDLGGMADVPASERVLPTATKYVSTTDAARYLPRVNHHVYNGSQWVNKGLFVESEARTNLVTYSNSNWVAMGGGTITTNATTGPDGVTSATLYTPPATTTVCGTRTNAYTTSTGTLSCYIKSNGVDTVSLWHSNGNAGRAVFNLLSGEITSPSNVDNYGIEDIGNGWWRCFIYSATYTTQSVRIYAGDGSSATYNGTDGFYVYGAQHETQATPSSYIPTNGASVTRPAESITIPAANLPWPTPQYVTGEELVTNGTFDTDTSGWTISSADPSSGWVAGEVYILSNGSGANLAQTWVVEANKTYEVTLDVKAQTVSGAAYGTLGGVSLYPTGSLTVGDGQKFIVTTVSTAALSFSTYSTSGHSFTFDNISVKEINPLALSVQMSGEMTYADTGTGGLVTGGQGEAVFFLQKDDGSNFLEAYLGTDGVNAGDVVFAQNSNGTRDTSVADETYSPDINVPFNISCRHGSTFVQGAADGTATTENTTPVALPDLSSTDLDLAYDFMGTISLFRIWADDLGDTGIEEASEPSTQATLFLSFDGSNNSYIDFDWNE